jgi:hypothetical protein
MNKISKRMYRIAQTQIGFSTMESAMTYLFWVAFGMLVLTGAGSLIHSFFLG